MRAWSILMAGVFVLTQPLSTATITVTGGCSLADAITAANTDSATGGCPAGSGLDTIELTGDVLLTSALPIVAGETMFDGNNHTVGRDAGAPDFRIFELDVSGDVEMRDIRITNGAADDGAGIFADSSALTLQNTTITGNEATARGGGIYAGVNLSTLSLNESTISDNTALDGGGVYSGLGAYALIESSTISGNVASDDGGGFYNVMHNYTVIVNSTISGNVAGDKGGGLYNQFYSGDMTLINTTVVGNAASEGGGVYVYPTFLSPTPKGYYTQVNLTNTLIADNAGGNCMGDQTDQGGNFDDDGTCLGASPVISGVDFDDTLANNGGPTLTHALLPGSVAIDAGGACGIGTDQRGFARDALCDSGAVELGAAPVGGSLSDVRGVNVSCSNRTTGSVVSFALAAGADSWDCEAQGLVVTAGDVISQSVQGEAIDGAGGTVIGLSADRALCRNATTGLSVGLNLATGPSWDCVAGGLTVNAGDRIRISSLGTVP